MVNRRQVIKAAAAVTTILAMPKHAFSASTFNGLYPAGSWIPAKQPMIQVYPRPDSETNTWARHHWAYYDGVNSVQYKIPLGVSFGAFPYVYQLLSGPPGMTIGASFWQSDWSFAQAAAAGYGYLLWTPSGSVTNASVSVLVTDQQMNTLTITFTVSTSSSTAQFIFIDAVKGNDSTGTGTISAPWQTFNKARGSTYNGTANPNTLCYLRAGTYAIPADASNSIDVSTAISQINTSIKPSAFMGFPGDTAPVLTLTGAMFGVGIPPAGGSDLFMQGLNFNGYNAGAANARIIWVAAYGTTAARMTFDNNLWSNSGYGSQGSNNATGYYMDSNSGTNIPYTFINNCSESNRQSGHPGNNYIGCSFYSAINCLVQGCSINQSGLNADGAWYFKSNVTNGCMRGNFALLSNVGHAFDFGQAPSGAGLMENSESCYNILIAPSGGGIILAQTGGYAYGTLWCYRNSVLGSPGYNSNQATSNGPYVFDSNVSQGGGIPTGSSIQTNGLNVVASSGALDATTGQLTGTYRTKYLGTVGAEIALGSAAPTPNAPNLKVT